MVACEGVVSGTWAYAREKTTAWRARASRFGVSPNLDPRKPMRSARVVSRVISTMLGRDETAGPGAPGAIGGHPANSIAQANALLFCSLKGAGFFRRGRPVFFLC